MFILNFKEKIRSDFIGEVLIYKYHDIQGKILPKFISDEKAIKKYYKSGTGKTLDLENPLTFCEKLNWYKLNDRNPLMTKCADKVGVREYVKENGYENCLNEIYGVYSDVNDIDVFNLPKKFVIKAAHGTHMQIIVTDKEKLNWKKAKIQIRNWLKQDIYWRGREWVYKDMPHRIIIEKYLEDESGGLKDYKFFCFNGTPKFVQVDIGRYKTQHYRNYYDLEWDLMNFTDDEALNNSDTYVEQPKSFDFMIKIAQDLSKPFQFVRVDFYEVDGKPYLGEMTFYDGGGMVNFIPDKWNKIVGDYWTLVKRV